MGRRLFIRQLASGLLLPLIPWSLGEATAGPRMLQAPSPFGGLGRLQHLAVSWRYSAAVTNKTTLRQQVSADLKQLEAVTGLPFPDDLAERLFAQNHFGTYDLKLPVGDTQLTCQVLARIAVKDAPLTRSVSVQGSNGTLTTANWQQFRVSTLQGRIRQLTHPLPAATSHFPHR